MNEEGIKEKKETEKAAGWWHEKIRHLLKTDDVFWNNEVEANLYITFVLYLLTTLLMISDALTYLGIFNIPMEYMNNVLMLTMPVLAAAIAASWIIKGQKPWLKHLLCLAVLYTVTVLYIFLNFFIGLIMTVPVILSVRYYSSRFTKGISVLTFLEMAAAEYMAPEYGLFGEAMGNVSVLLPSAVRDKNFENVASIGFLLQQSFLLRALILLVVSLICIELSERAHMMVIQQDDISRKSEAIKAELDVATDIQDAVLPKLNPAFPDRDEFDVIASTSPAKEVGGDFYDYYLVDDDHLLFLAADASGKGVPAALFMMITKILVKTHAYAEKDLKKVVETVNRELNEDNKEMMFCTAWIGILEISTGLVTAVDCGHEYPYLCRRGGSYELLKNPKSPALGVVRKAEFTSFDFKLGKGDCLYLYTDGIPEAKNSEDEFYGLERLKISLDKYRSENVNDILIHTREDLNVFVKDASQFDDITMMSLLYRGK